MSAWAPPAFIKTQNETAREALFCSCCCELVNANERKMWSNDSVGRRHRTSGEAGDYAPGVAVVLSDRFVRSL